MDSSGVAGSPMEPLPTLIKPGLIHSVTQLLEQWCSTSGIQLPLSVCTSVLELQNV